MDGSGAGADEGAPPSSLPPVRLPVVSDTLPTQTQTQPPPEDEEDLFGSEGEEDAPPAPAPAAPAAGRAVAAAAAATEAQLFGDDDDELDEAALFGDEGDPTELDERVLFGSEDEGAADEAALFGTDDEGAAPGPAAPRSPALSELSEMDEREIFGEVSDDEPEKVEEVQLRRRPAPGDDRIFCSLRLPNVLSIEREPFRADAIPQTQLEGYKEFMNTQGKLSTRLLNPENCVRWRFQKGPDGEQLEDEEGRPKYESNTRIVEWEDGSRTLHVGSETFDMSDVDDHVLIFEENSQSVQVCHGSLRKRFVITPKDLKSATHESLKRAQYSRFEANRRSLLMSQEEQDAEQLAQQLRGELRDKQRRDELLAKRALEEGQMTAAFLEDDVRSEAGDAKRARTS